MKWTLRGWDTGDEGNGLYECYRRGPLCLCCLISWTLYCAPAGAQTATVSSEPTAAPATPTADVLGRTTPRGTVLGFVKAARQGRYETAAEYLNTRLRGPAAESLAHELFVVLDRRLPARLNELSVRPEGSPSVPTKELVGTISSQSADVDILLERVKRGRTAQLWLFSTATLDSIPPLYEEVSIESLERALPAFLVETEFGGIALCQWIALFGGLPIFFLAMAFLNLLLSRSIGRLRRLVRKDLNQPDPNVLPAPIRILLLAGTIFWAITKVALPLLARQFWSSTANILTIVAFVWLACMLTAWIERHMRERSIQRDQASVVLSLRLARWGVNLVIIITGIVIGLHHFGINPNAGLAGVGVGGIAVALAAQKTLENVVGGVSIIFDQAVRVGDLVRVGETLGHVEDIGLRSTRIRTFDRTMVNVPNGQLATVTLENFSLRDQFWFHHTLRLRHETTTSQMHSILDGVTTLLADHPSSVRETIRVRFQSFGASSFDVEIFSYLAARDWNEFLRMQEQLLLQIREAVQSAEAHLAIPAQTTYLIVSSGADSSSAPASFQHSRDAA